MKKELIIDKFVELMDLISESENSVEAEEPIKSIESNEEAVKTDEDFLTIDMLAKRLNITRATVYTWIKRGYINFRLIGNKKRFLWSEIIASSKVIDYSKWQNINKELAKSPFLK